MSSSSSHNGLLLPGLDGTNPLGFLAALGVLRVLTLSQHSTVKLSWKFSEGCWRPEIYGIQIQLIDLGVQLHSAIKNLDKSAWSIDKELPFHAEKLRNEAVTANKNSSWSNRLKVDIISAFGVESCREEKKVKKEEIEIFKETDFRLIRSGDNQHNGLLEYATFTLSDCNENKIQRTLDSDWLYRDEKKSFRWDPAEDRGYALQWGDPSDDGALTERGANCLALFGLVSFPVIPVRDGVKTTGFGLPKSKQSSFTWPIWNYPINMSVISSLLASSELQQEQPDWLELTTLGIAAVYRCDRIMTSTYYANFTPARRVG